MSDHDDFENVTRENAGYHENMRKLTFDKAFELTGHGKFNYAVMLSCGLILLNVMMESMNMSYVLPFAECDLNLSNQQKGLISASAFIGIISGSYPWGYLADVKGRRGVMLPCIFLTCVLSLCSSLAVDHWTLLILRILTGFCLSGSASTVFAYIGELHTLERRASAIAWCSAFNSVAFVVLPCLAWVIMPLQWRFHLMGSLELLPFRIFMMCCSIPGIIALIALIFLPESPKYLHAMGKSDEALKTLRHMYAVNTGQKAESFPVETITDTVTPRQTGANLSFLKNLWNQTVPLVKLPLLRCTLICFATLFTNFMLANGLYLWTPDILKSLLQKSNTGQTVCLAVMAKQHVVLNTTYPEIDLTRECRIEVSTTMFPVAILMGISFAVTGFAIGLIINKIGKGLLYILIMAVCGLSTLTIAWVPQREVALALLIISLCSGCAGAIIVSLAIDVFPTQLRATVMCLMYMVGRAGAVVGANLLGSMIDTNCEMAFVVFGVIAMVGTLLVLLWPKPDIVRENLELKGMAF